MILKVIVLTLIIESATILGRFFFGSIKEKYKKIKSPYKIRIHHGYIGLVMMLIQNETVLILGTALFFSDLIHHFLVLPLWVGRTEFP
ncbi:MAG: hypothetical protein AAB836_01945 [Patescibacteria group bacterium]